MSEQHGQRMYGVDPTLQAQIAQLHKMSPSEAPAKPMSGYERWRHYGAGRNLGQKAVAVTAATVVGLGGAKAWSMVHSVTPDSGPSAVGTDIVPSSTAPLVELPSASASASASASPSASNSPSALPSASPSHRLVLVSPSASPRTEHPTKAAQPSSAPTTPAAETSPVAPKPDCYMDAGEIMCRTTVYSHQFASENSPYGPAVNNAVPNCGDRNTDGSLINGMINISMDGGPYWTSPHDLGFNPCTA